MIEVAGSVLIGVLTMSSLSGTGRRETYSCVTRAMAGVGTDVHTVWNIDPNESTNMFVLLAFE